MLDVKAVPERRGSDSDDTSNVDSPKMNLLKPTKETAQVSVIMTMRHKTFSTSPFVSAPRRGKDQKRTA
jgi:hypothetical protein